MRWIRKWINQCSTCTVGKPGNLTTPSACSSGRCSADAVCTDVAGGRSYDCNVSNVTFVMMEIRKVYCRRRTQKFAFSIIMRNFRQRKFPKNVQKIREIWEKKTFTNSPMLRFFAKTYFRKFGKKVAKFFLFKVYIFCII